MLFLLCACNTTISTGERPIPTPKARPTLSIDPSPTPQIIQTHGDFVLDPEISRRAQEGKPLVIRVSYADISNEFAPFIRRGVVRSVEDFKANVEMIGPVGNDANVQISELERMLEIGIDGLAIAPVNSEALAPIINRYLDQGIPVVTFNIDNPVSNRLAFAGQNLERSGYEAAKLLIDMLGGKGDIVITTLDPLAQWSMAREAGAKRAISEYPDINLVQVLDTGTEPLEIYTSIEEFMEQHADIQGILSLECCSTPYAGEYVKHHNLVGDIIVVGFDELPRTLELIEEGVINASISQDPERQSYEAVKMLVSFINGSAESFEDIDTGIAVITPQNVDDFSYE